MVRAMPAYDPDRACPQCDGPADTATRDGTHEVTPQLTCTVPARHVLRTCRSCGYRWCESIAAGPQKAGERFYIKAAPDDTA